jgi:SAM-dependent methyltransferase
MKEKSSAYYDNLRQNEWKNTADFGPSCSLRYRIINKLVKKYFSNEAHIIDIGCGSGNLLSVLRKNGFVNIYGSDFSQESVDSTNRKIVNQAFRADIKDIMSFGDIRYDGVICADVLEHIENDALAVSNMYCLLKKDGLLILSVPYNTKYWSSHDEFSGHIRRYDVNDLEKKITRSGFDILESFGWGNLVYSLYYKLLISMEPSSVMKQAAGVFKKAASRILYIFFLMESLVKSKKNAKRLFIVARKRVEGA